MTKEQILQEAKALQEEIKSHRLWLHTHAETGFDLTETKPYVKSALTEMGYAVHECGKAGLVTTVGKPGGKVLLLRADMDALPIAEEADVDFACKNGRMHACGHDMHTAMLLGAAKILKAHESELGGTVKLMFQPAEEIFEGSKDMIASGVLENPRPDAALMIHVAAGMPLPAGTVVVSAPGVSAPAADYFTIRVHGKGCHGSAPQNGIDPLTAAAHILIALQEIHARELSASDEAVLTIGTFHAGEAGNVIPDTATMGGTIRTYDEKTRAYLKERMTAIAQSIAEAFRASAEVSFGSGCPTLVNDKDLSEKSHGVSQRPAGRKPRVHHGGTQRRQTCPGRRLGGLCLRQPRGSLPDAGAGGGRAVQGLPLPPAPSKGKVRRERSFHRRGRVCGLCHTVYERMIGGEIHGGTNPRPGIQMPMLQCRSALWAGRPEVDLRILRQHL